MFTQYKFSPVQLGEAAVAAAKSAAANQPGVEPLRFAAETVAGRLRINPASYLQYGPYWWAVKRVLRVMLVQDFGPQDDPVLRAEYGDRLHFYAVLVAAEQFRDAYNATFLAGTAQFWLDVEAELPYVLFDADMEFRVLGARRPALLAADACPVVIDGEPLMDAVPAGTDAPGAMVSVKFEHGAELWAAIVSAPDAAAADAKVRLLDASGRLARAIDANRGIGQPALDSTAPEQPLFVDRAARRVVEMAPANA